MNKLSQHKISKVRSLALTMCTSNGFSAAYVHTEKGNKLKSIEFRSQLVDEMHAICQSIIDAVIQLF